MICPECQKTMAYKGPGVWHCVCCGNNLAGDAQESADPDHYKGDVECIDAIRSALGQEGFVAYCRGTVMRYCWRMGRKDDPLVEIAKLQNYAAWIKDTLDGKPLRKNP
jgi:hypothetical protein